jgi:nucleoside-diphosphate-sugar epimerase
MRALVTGSAGFVGRHFVGRLLEGGWSVVTCDVASMPDPKDCRTVFAENHGPFDLVIHCAAVVGGRAKIDGAPMAVADNLSIDAALWQWALRTRPGRIVYFSSSAAYPTALQDHVAVFLAEHHIDLEAIDHPDATYGLAKLVGEVQAELVRQEGVPVTVIRPFSGYGEDQALDYPFPSFIARAAAREDPFVIWGDGQQNRDFIHIDDIVDFTMACVDQGVDGPVNACTGRPTSFNELATLVCRQAGYMPDIEYLTDRPTGVRYRVGDPTLMHEVWRPRIPLEEGVRRALAA